MDKKNPPCSLEWPHWTWRDSSWWIGCLSLLFAFVLLRWPNQQGFTSNSYITFVVFLTICFAIALFLVIHFYKIMICFARRGYSYGHLYSSYIQRINELKNAQMMILSYIIDSRGFHVHKNILFKGEISILIKKKRGSKLEKDTFVSVIDSRDGMPMGIFQVTETRSDDYVAKNVNYIDPNWSGYLHNMGDGEFGAPPGLIACIYNESEE